MSSDRGTAMRHSWIKLSSCDHFGLFFHCLHLCLLIQSNRLIQFFHNTSFDFNNYIFLSKKGGEKIKSFGAYLMSFTVCTLQFSHLSACQSRAVGNDCHFVSATTNLWTDKYCTAFWLQSSRTDFTTSGPHPFISNTWQHFL